MAAPHNKGGYKLGGANEPCSLLPKTAQIQSLFLQQLKVVVARMNLLSLASILIVEPLLEQYKLSKSGSHLTSKMGDGTALKQRLPQFY